MQDTNWDLVKFKYEVLGNSLDELAAEHHLSLPVLKFNSKDWKQIPLASEKPLDLKDITSLEDILTKLGDQTATQTKAFAILKQKFLGPKYVELETILLYKAIEMAQVNTIDARTLQTLVSVLTSLLSNNSLLSPSVEGGDGHDKKWEIMFVDAEEKKTDEKLDT